MQLDHDFKSKWEQIVNDVDKEHCPTSCVKKVIFRTVDRKQKTINLHVLRRQGLDEESIETAVTKFIADNEEDIASMELVLDVEAVAGIIQPETDKLLKDI